MSLPAPHTSILRIVARHFPSLMFGYPRTYKVAAVRSDKRLDLVPPEDARELPELDGVEQWGLGLITPAVGASVLVYFRDANPSRPVVVGWEHGADHERIDLLENDDAAVADPTGRFIRYGDSVTIPGPSGGATGAVAPGAPPSSASRVRG